MVVTTLLVAPTMRIPGEFFFCFKGVCARVGGETDTLDSKSPPDDNTTQPRRTPREDHYRLITIKYHISNMNTTSSTEGAGHDFRWWSTKFKINKRTTFLTTKAWRFMVLSSRYLVFYKSSSTTKIDSLRIKPCHYPLRDIWPNLAFQFKVTWSHPHIFQWCMAVTLLLTPSNNHKLP